MIEVKFQPGNAQRELASLMARLPRTRPLMAGIAAEMLNQTEHQFEREGDPRWKRLAASTIERRKKKGTWPGRILQISPAGLAASMQTGHTDASATLGSNKPYAAIQHFGGQAGKGRKVTIPERPYMPLMGQSPNVKLTPKAEDAITRMVRRFVEG